MGNSSFPIAEFPTVSLELSSLSSLFKAFSSFLSVPSHLLFHPLHLKCWAEEKKEERSEITSPHPSRIRSKNHQFTVKIEKKSSHTFPIFFFASLPKYSFDYKILTPFSASYSDFEIYFYYVRTGAIERMRKKKRLKLK